jgi:hypothetical protein
MVKEMTHDMPPPYDSCVLTFINRHQQLPDACVAATTDGGQDPSEGGKNASGRWLVVLILTQGLQGAPAWDNGTP